MISDLEKANGVKNPFPTSSAHVSGVARGPLSSSPGQTLGWVGLTFPQSTGPALGTISVSCFRNHHLPPGFFVDSRRWLPLAHFWSKTSSLLNRPVLLRTRQTPDRDGRHHSLQKVKCCRRKAATLCISGRRRRESGLTDWRHSLRSRPQLPTECRTECS